MGNWHLKSIWRTMKTKSHSESIWVNHFSGTEAPGTIQIRTGVHLGMEILAKRRTPVVYFPEANLANVSTAGFEIASMNGNVGLDDPVKRHLVVRCVDTNLSTVFFRFIDQILDLMAGGIDLQHSIESAFDAWSRFLSPQDGGVMDFSKIVGLWGELHLMKLMLAQSCDANKTVKAWGGPEKQDWDYLIPGSKNGNQIEVKTSVGSELKIHINNPRQLAVESGFAWLMVVKIAQTPQGAGGDSLPDLVASLLDGGYAQGLEGNLFRNSLLEKLKLYGYSPAQEEYYLQFSFRSLEVLWYKVDQNFPILRQGDIAQSIRGRLSDFTYSLSLAGLKPESQPELKF
jgi:hypothetical protein